MPDSSPTNKLSIYLIKPELIDHEEILDSISSLERVQLNTSTVLYYKKSGGSQPAWINKFFGGSLSDDIKSKLYTAYVSAVALVSVNFDGENRTFAITFGLGGWQMLSPGSYEERFGLMCTLNLVSPKTLKSIDKSNMGLAPKQAREQISQEGEIADFGIDIEQDLIKSVTGKCKDASYGTTVTGKDSLHVSAKIDINDIEAKLRQYYEAYSSDNYKTTFNWIDHIKEIKDPLIISVLESSLDEKLTDTSEEKIWLAVPDVIEWSDIEGFRFQGERNVMHPDLFMKNMRDFFVSQAIDVTAQNLKNHYAQSISASNGHVVNKWKLFNCLYAEVTNNASGKFYILSNGKWYNIETNFAAQINAEYAAILDTKINFPDFNIGIEDEQAYNTRAATEMQIDCFDRQLIQYGGGHSSIEFCDLLDRSNHLLIHVKKYGGSSVLSHLFNQGVVSAELMLGDQSYRERANTLVNDVTVFSNPTVQPQATNYTIIFGVMSGSTKALDLPFFSKVSLRNAKQRLQLYGFKVSLQKIQGITG